MRKYLIVAIAALAAMVFATTVSVAQTPEATMKVNIKPKKAGTKKKPKNSSIELDIVNGNPKRTLDNMVITAPKTFTLSAKGLTKCSEAGIMQAQSIAQCPKASKVGGGEAHALAGVTAANPTPLTFKVTALVLGPKKLGFFLEGQEAPINVLAPGTISGRKLKIQVPEQAQQLAGLYNGLVSIHTTLKAKKGKHYLASTTGCKNKKHPFSVALSFINNGATTAATITAKASSKCTK